MQKRLKLLIVDDDEEEYLILKDLLTGARNEDATPKFELDWISTYEEAVKALGDCQYDLYLVDYQLGGRSGLDLLHEAVTRRCTAPIIILTGQGSYETDVDAMQAGAMDYLEKKQLTLPLLERSIRYAIGRKDVEEYLKSILQERAQTVEKIQKQAHEIAALQKATSALLKTLDISVLLGEILDEAQEAITTSERSWLHLFSANGRLNKLSGMQFDDSRIYKIKSPKEKNEAILQVAQGHGILIPDTGAEAQLLSLVENEQERLDIHSAIVAPLILGEEFFGALSLTSSRSSAFSDSDLRLLTSLAETATAAIHNAILHTETQNLAATDPLTGQLNRRTFFEFGEREIERFRRFGRPVSALMFDVDKFKAINDNYGHLAGDQILVGIVERCCSVIRHVDVLGRYGGDEFAILLPETDPQVAGEIADRIRNSITNSPIMTDAGPIPVTVSIGIADATERTNELANLLEKADQALYQSKQAGRNRITVSK